MELKMTIDDIGCAQRAIEEKQLQIELKRIDFCKLNLDRLYSLGIETLGLIKKGKNHLIPMYNDVVNTIAEYNNKIGNSWRPPNAN